jgi:hypothetical protein
MGKKRQRRAERPHTCAAEGSTPPKRGLAMRLHTLTSSKPCRGKEPLSNARPRPDHRGSVRYAIASIAGRRGRQDSETDQVDISSLSRSRHERLTSRGVRQPRPSPSAPPDQSTCTWMTLTISRTTGAKLASRSPVPRTSITASAKAHTPIRMAISFDLVRRYGGEIQTEANKPFVLCGVTRDCRRFRVAWAPWPGVGCRSARLVLADQRDKGADLGAGEARRVGGGHDAGVVAGGDARLSRAVTWWCSCRFLRGWFAGLGPVRVSVYAGF